MIEGICYLFNDDDVIWQPELLLTFTFFYWFLKPLPFFPTQSIHHSSIWITIKPEYKITKITKKQNQNQINER